jgi:LacI family transcriptional regulator
MPRLTDAVLAVMFEAAEDRAREHGYQAVTLSTRDRHHEERRLVERLLDRRADGLILATAIIDDPLLPELETRGVPFVLLNRASGDYPSVRGDDEAGGYLATRHLLGQGHRRVGMLSGPPDVSTARYRLEGYHRAHAELGVAVDPTLIVPSSFTLDGGVEAGTRILTRPERPTALVTVNDATAVGVMAVARDLHLSIPADLAIVGYNDTDLAPMLPVPLTSVAVPLEEMGRLAVDVLVDRLADPAAPIAGRTYTPQLMVRASSQSPPPGNVTRASLTG